MTANGVAMRCKGLRRTTLSHCKKFYTGCALENCDETLVAYEPMLCTANLLTIK